MGDYFLVFALRADHHTIKPGRDRKNKHFHTAFELRDWAHMQTACDLLRPERLQDALGPDATASGTICFAITAARTG